MPVFRGHHLICLHFFNGEGYDIEFVKNLRDLLGVAEYVDVEVCRGADGICKKCPYLKDDICQYDEDSEEEIQKMDDKALDLLECTSGEKVKLYMIREKLPEIFFEWYRSFCLGCDWKEVCEKNRLFKKLKSVV